MDDSRQEAAVCSMSVATLDLSVIILTYNEELHIRRCLERVRPIARRVVVVDCYSTDQTVAICKELGAEVVQHEWPGNQARQFNWALQHLDIQTEWVLRLDADEYLLPELVEELQERVPTLPADITGIEFKRRHIFMERWMKHGIYPVIILRMFRTGCALYDNRLMDEHLALQRGRSVVFEHDFCDHNLMNLSYFCKKHVDYATREAVEILDECYGLRNGGANPSQNDASLGKQAQDKHAKKNRYNRMPLFWRSFAYFCYRYFLKGACLDGKEGFVFTFLQGWWYRTLVDAKVYEVKKACGTDKEKIRAYLKKEYQIEI